MLERIKEHDTNIRFVLTQTSIILVHAKETGHVRIWNKVMFIDREAMVNTSGQRGSIRLHPKNINGDSGIKIFKTWIPMV